MPLTDSELAHLRDDDELYAEECLKVVDERGELVPLRFRASQRKVSTAAAAQRRAGQPVRLLVLKSRKTGVSTQVQGRAIQRGTLVPNTRAVIVAHDLDTAGELHEIGEVMYANLPGEIDSRLKPLLVEKRSGKGSSFMRLGQPSRELRSRGDVGVNSTLSVDTAKQVEAGRGKTIRFLHGSEVAFWPDPKKLLSLMNAVPDFPETEVYLESTANGANFFKRMVDRARRSEGRFALVFISWLEDPNCWLEFPDLDAGARFVESIGRGDYGADEPDLIARGATPEQLHWRRTAIVDKADGKIDLFKQEYPSTIDEAFIASGKQVFSVQFVGRALLRAAAFDPEHDESKSQLGQEVYRSPSARSSGDPLRFSIAPGVHVPPEHGLILPSRFKERKVGRDTFEVPAAAAWVPREATGFTDNHDFMRLWEHPVNEASEAGKPLDARRPEGQYIIACDPMSGEQNSDDELARHGVQVIDHRTLEQVATYDSRVDPDELADLLFATGLYFNTGWVVVEMTGGYGIPVYNRLAKLGYRRLYNRVQSHEERILDPSEKLGWSTNLKTKPLLEARAAELLRQGVHGLRCMTTALQLTTYVRLNDRGKTGPEPDAYSDLLMAWMIGQEVAAEKALRPDRLPGQPKSTSSLTRTLRPEWQR